MNILTNTILCITLFYEFINNVSGAVTAVSSHTNDIDMSFFASDPRTPPNVVMLMFDDLGWMDLSQNGGQIPTPNMDSLFTESINLKRHYVGMVGSISRSQFLTGRYAMYSGYGKMSSFGVGNIGGIPVGLPTLPQWLKAYNSDYTTYGVGKWFLGYATNSLLPKNKGFDHFFGAYSGAIYYSSGKVVANKDDRYDFHEDGNDYDPLTMYTDSDDSDMNTMSLFRDKILQYIDIESRKTTPFYMFLPLQSPHGPLENTRDYKEECRSLIDGTSDDAYYHRLKYCEILRASDDIVGDIVHKLKESGKWQNTLFILTTDNGGDIQNTGRYTMYFLLTSCCTHYKLYTLHVQDVTIHSAAAKAHYSKAVNAL